MQFSLAQQPRYRIFFLILILAGVMAYPSPRVYGAHSKADSLQKQLFRTDDISRKISLYLEISKTFEGVDADSATLYWKEAQNLAIRMKNDKPLADIYAQGAFFALKQNQLDQAFLNFTLAAKYYSNAGEHARYVTMKSMMGSICLVRDNIADAMSYYMEVIEEAERLKLYKTLPHVLNNVGNIYLESDDFDQALGYFTRALQLFRETGDSYNPVYPLLNMGECYYYLGNLRLAGDYVRQSMEPARKANDNVLEARGFMLLGMIQSKKKRLPRGHRFIQFKPPPA
jgi:tetratricopeptide (TPR) repeat protein